MHNRLLPPEQVWSARAKIQGLTDDERPFVTDKAGNCWLVDSGSQITLVPRTGGEAEDSTLKLTTVSGAKLAAYGSKAMDIQFGRKRYRVEVVVADVSRPILGTDFLKQYRMSVSYYDHALVDRVNGSNVPFTLKDAQGLQWKAVAKVEVTKDELTGNPRFVAVARQYPGMLTHDFKAEEVKHGVVHYIDTGKEPPYRTKPRPLAGPKAVEVKKAWMDLLSKGIIERCNSNWSSGLHLVWKTDGSIRPVGDFRALNSKTKLDCYPLPNLRYFTARLRGATVFSQIDLLKAYHQIPIAPEDRRKTAVATPFGLFQFRRLPMGLCNAAQSFQKAMEDICQDLEGVFIYLDDILVFAKDADEHEARLHALFKKLEANGLAISPGKSVLGVSEVSFVGYKVSEKGIEPLPKKVQAITEFPRPETPKKLLGFLGMLNYYRHLLPRAAGTLQPLYTAASVKKASDYKWTESLETSFRAAKELLAGYVVLRHPDPQAPIALTTDASDVAMGAVLEQYINGQWQPLGYWSKHFKKEQVRWSTFERELYAVQQGLRHFRSEVEGRHVVVWTDHQPLVYAVKAESLPHLDKCHRQLIEIAQYTTDVRHLPGKINVVADTLSRQPPMEVEAVQQVALQTVDHQALAKAQEECPEVQAHKEGCDPTLVGPRRLKGELSGKFETREFAPGVELFCEVSTGRARPMVPVTWRRTVFNVCHGLIHQGRKATVQKVGHRYFWPAMNKEVAAWTKQCEACQRVKITRRIEPGVQPFQVPERRFTVVHTDVVGPLPVSQEYRYLLTIIDRTTRHFVAVPMKAAESEDCAKAFIHGWIQNFGLPEVLVSDQGNTFTANLWTQLHAYLGVEPKYSPVYHPQANGLVERTHKDLKDHLRCRMEAAGREWMDQLPWVMLGMRSAYRPDLDTSSAELVYGAPLTIPGDLVGAPVEQEADSEDAKRLLKGLRRLAASRETPTARHGVPEVYYPQAAREATHVFVERTKAQAGTFGSKYQGPFEIVERIGARELKLLVGETAGGEPRYEVQDWSRCKVAHMAPGATVAKRVNRGRKPKKLSPTAKEFKPRSAHVNHKGKECSRQGPSRPKEGEVPPPAVIPSLNNRQEPHSGEGKGPQQQVPTAKNGTTRPVRATRGQKPKRFEDTSVEAAQGRLRI